MGSQYSVNGFLNAALRRTGKTLLVEGPSDKQVIHRLILEANLDNASCSSIDHAGILDDESLKGMGNKQKVSSITSEALLLASHFPRILDVLATLTDREWDGISLPQSFAQFTWSPPVQSASAYTTFGHSIENYSFHKECMTAFMKFYWPDLVSIALISEIENTFESMLIFASALSLEIKALSCINKFGGAVKPSHIEIKNNRVYLDQDFIAICNQRRIPFLPSRLSEFNVSMESQYNSLEGLEFVKWIPHGHIGEEILWSAVAKVCLNYGFPVEKVEDIAFGNKKEKARFCADWLCKTDPQLRQPLDEIVSWLGRD